MLRSRSRFGFLAVAFFITCLAIALFGLLMPEDAQALETVKCTGRPNGPGSSSDVIGGLETRITWEGRAAADESLTSIGITFPEGASYELKDASLLMLSGDDLMTRTSINASFQADGQTFRALLDEPAEAGGYFRLIIYGVTFPAEAGSYQLTGSYTTAEGIEATFDDIPAIPIVHISRVERFANELAQQPWVIKWNSHKFLKLFLNPPILVSSLPIVVKGFFMALAVVLVAFPLAIPVGLLLALMRMARLRLLRAIGSIYVNVVRGTPLFLQIYIAFFGLPLAGINPPDYVMGVIVLALNSAAYLCEIFRAGIQSISVGQTEAARSLGMNGAQTMFFVIIPQTVRRVIPTMTSEFILLYKDTSLLAAVGIMEVVMYARTIVATTGSITPYIVAACFYLIITLPLAKVVGNLEAKLAGNKVVTTKRKSRNSITLPGDAEEELAQLEHQMSAAGDDGYEAVSPTKLSSM